MGGPLGLGQKQGHLYWVPSLAAARVVILGLFLYVPFDAICIVSPAGVLGHSQLVPKCYCFSDSPSS